MAATPHIPLRRDYGTRKIATVAGAGVDDARRLPTRWRSRLCLHPAQSKNAHQAPWLIGAPASIWDLRCDDHPRDRRCGRPGEKIARARGLLTSARTPWPRFIGVKNNLALKLLMLGRSCLTRLYSIPIVDQAQPLPIAFLFNPSQAFQQGMIPIRFHPVP